MLATLPHELFRCLRTTPENYSDVANWPGRWLVCQANPQRLQSVVDTIEGFEVPCYVPRVFITRYAGKNRRRIAVPLFQGGYLFACLPTEAHHPATLRDWGISKIIPVVNQARLRDELQMIQAAIAHDPYASIHPGLTVGSPVEVVSGPMIGKRGFVEHIGARDRLVIRCDILGQSLSVELGAMEIELAA